MSKPNYYNLLTNQLKNISNTRVEEKICDSEKNIYECLEKIYDKLKQEYTNIFSNVIPYIQGGFALYLYGYDKFIKEIPILGTNDIDIHIESVPEVTEEKYNEKLQKFFVSLSKKIGNGNKIELNKLYKKWYYGTSTYIDITYEDNYISLSLYKQYCL